MRLEDNWGHLCASQRAGCVLEQWHRGVGQHLSLSPAPALSCCALGAEPRQSPDLVSPSFGHSSPRAEAEQAPTHQGIRKDCPCQDSSQVCVRPVPAVTWRRISAATSLQGCAPRD